MQRIYTFVSTLIIVLTVSCTKTSVKEGVTIELAQTRSQQVSQISYKLNFNIPTKISDTVTGYVDVAFTLKSKQDVILDFRNNARNAIINVLKDSKPINYQHENGHIIIPKRYTIAGQNVFSIAFSSADASLNRNESFLYTLLVPDRASTVFPCFDQPDLKAKFHLSLVIPAKWTALANGKIDSIRYINNEKKTVHFKPTLPISTYLFAFTTGEFKVETQTVMGKTFSMYHRETDNELLERNKQTLFNLHAQSLIWLEEYTGIEYPFGKLDFALIPGFQYSGMEHPGAIFYRDSRLLLDSNPSDTQKLQQANLIAHEVAHQWFGNLVTMKWFNDVWLKEVFAGFMADLIVNPQYPSINHDLGFVLSHFPRAYSVDRTMGANPIVQPLNNMLNAGTLYGDIIYHKAPIMMRQLEQIMGKDAFRDGVNEYLKTFSMGNATWDNLVEILDNHTETSLVEWSQIWTKETGRPMVKFDVSDGAVHFTPIDSTLVPPMLIEVFSGEIGLKTLWVDKVPNSHKIEGVSNTSELIVNSNAFAYGCFIPENPTIETFSKQLEKSISPIQRASIHLSLYEVLLDGNISPTEYLHFITKTIGIEQEVQITNFLLQKLRTTYWRLSNEQEREALSIDIEHTLWTLLKSNRSLEEKRPVLSCLMSVFTTNESYTRLYNAWSSQKIMGINLSEKERTRLAYELMIRKPELYHTIALGEIERINNPDRVAQFEFMLQALSPSPSERIAFFDKLNDASNRKPEPWVTQALQWLNHPLRADFSIRFIEPSLNLLPEIQQTGDIFFPKGWLDASLWGHSSAEAYEIVNGWINDNPKLSPNLKQKLLQSADMLYRANER